MATFSRLLGLVQVFLALFVYAGRSIEQIDDINKVKARGYFDLPLTYNSTSHLWMIPVYLGYHVEDFTKPFWCALDFTLPSIVVPNINCKTCMGQKYDPGSKGVGATQFKYPHLMSYFEFTNGSYTVQEEEELMILGFNPINHLAD